MPARWLYIALLLATSTPAHAQTIDNLQAEWTATFKALQSSTGAQSAFSRFNTDLKAYLATRPLDWRAEYLSGSLDCQFPAYRKLGASLLTDVVQTNRSLNPQGIAEVQKVIQACSAPLASAGTTVPSLPANVTLASVHYENPGVHGTTKMGTTYTPPTGHFHSDPVPVPDAVLHARLHTLGEEAQARTQAASLLGGHAVAIASGGFIVADPNGDTLRANGIAQCLGGYIAPLGNEFGIRPGKDLVTAYAAENVDDVYELARKLHGLSLGPGVLAYSVVEDQSLVSSGSPAACGSMGHELVHLWIRQTFPAAPPWLEEGIASEVAVATLTPAGFHFGWSWRDEVLRGSQRPPLNVLLQMSWQDMNGTGEFTAPAIQAEAAVFVRFLAERGKLLPIYQSARDRHTSADLSSVRPYDSIVEEEYGQPVSALDADFDRWLQAESRGHEPLPQAAGPAAQHGPRICSTPADIAELQRFQQSPVQGTAPCVLAPSGILPAANAPPRPIGKPEGGNGTPQ